MRMLLCVLALLAALPAAAGPGDVEYQFLRSEGAGLHRVALNGATVASGSAISLSLPVYITKYLRDGPNELEVEYTSDTRVGLSVVIETRAQGPRREQVARFYSAPGETGGDRVAKTLPFTIHLRPQAALRFTDADEQAIMALLHTYYNTLARRDGAALRKLYEKAVGEEAQIYPEGIGLFQWVLNDSLRVIASPQFRMKPFQRTGLRFSVAGQVVVVTRPDQSPVVESETVELDDENVPPQAGRAGGEKTKSSLKPVSLSFKRYDGRWYLALPFGF